MLIALIVVSLAGAARSGRRGHRLAQRRDRSRRPRRSGRSGESRRARPAVTRVRAVAGPVGPADRGDGCLARGARGHRRDDRHRLEQCVARHRRLHDPPAELPAARAVWRRSGSSRARAGLAARARRDRRLASCSTVVGIRGTLGADRRACCRSWRSRPGPGSAVWSSSRSCPRTGWTLLRRVPLFAPLNLSTHRTAGELDGPARGRDGRGPDARG